MDADDPEKRIAELERQLAEPSGPANTPPGGALTAEQVHNVAFSKPPIGQRGYNEDEVDAFLDFLETALRDPARPPVIAEQIRSVAFSKPPIGKRGYNEDEVDAFLEFVEQQIGSGQGASAVAPRVAFPLASAGRSHARDGAGPETGFRRIANAVIDFLRSIWE
jgi:DivIVA domain-containing protein